MIILHAFVTIIITAHFRKQWLAWAICLSFVIYANKYAYFSPPPEVYYIEYSFYLYTAIQVNIYYSTLHLVQCHFLDFKCLYIS